MPITEKASLKFYETLDDIEKAILHKYNHHIENDLDQIESLLFMNDGYAPLDSQGYPQSSFELDILTKLDKYKNWKYQANMYVELLKFAGIPLYSGNGCVLDFGCGKGGGLSLFEDLYTFNQLYGLDLNVNHLNIAESQTKKTTFKLSTYKDIPIESTSVDVVTTVESINYYSDITKFLIELQRITKKEGKILISSSFTTDELVRLYKGIDKTSLTLVDTQDITSYTKMSCSISKIKHQKTSSMIYEIFKANELRYENLDTRYLNLLLKPS